MHTEGLEEEHLTALTTSSSAMPTYGGTACTLVGNDERNGRVNPALEVNDDEIDLTEMKRRKAARRTGNQNSNHPMTGPNQSQTTL